MILHCVWLVGASLIECGRERPSQMDPPLLPGSPVIPLGRNGASYNFQGFCTNPIRIHTRPSPALERQHFAFRQARLLYLPFGSLLVVVPLSVMIRFSNGYRKTSRVSSARLSETHHFMVLILSMLLLTI